MTYTWHAVDGRMAEICDECGFDARELVDGVDETARLDAAYACLERLLDHADADRRPQPDTWSAREYAAHCVEVAGALLAYAAEAAGTQVPTPPGDLAGCRESVRALVPGLTDSQRGQVLHGVYRQPVTVEWVVRHLLHDTEHHVLDVRRGYAQLAMGDLPEVSFRG